MPIDRQWNIAGRARRCADSDRPFVEGEEIYTALFLNEETDQFERRDFSKAAWESRGDDSKVFSSWKSEFVPPPPAPAGPEIVEHESPERLLRRLLEENDPATVNARFILAIMLERKKVLQQTDLQEENGLKLRIYRHRKSDEIFVIQDPGLKLDTLDSVQAEVVTLLATPARAAPPAEGSADAESKNGQEIEA